MTKTETAWLAGLLEGEGCFRVYRESRTNQGRDHLRVTVSMTDEDVLDRAAKLLGVNTTGPYAPKKAHWSPYYKLQVTGADAATLMRSVLPYMGLRRSTKIKECLAAPNLNHHNRPTKSCQGCGHKFTPHRRYPQQRFCNEGCRLAHRKRGETS